MKDLKSKIAELRVQIGKISKDKKNPFFNSEWAWVNGYRGRYAVSDQGDIISIYKNGKYKVLKQNITRDGYCLVRLYKKNKHKDKLVSRIVARAFVDNPKDRSEVNHIDGDKENNSAQNLEWVSRSENMAHAFSSGLKSVRKGEDSNMSTLTRNQVLDIRNAYRLGCFSQTEIAKAYDLSPQGAHNIIRRKTWRHL